MFIDLGICSKTFFSKNIPQIMNFFHKKKCCSIGKSLKTCKQCQHYWEGCYLRSKRGARVLEQQHASLFDCPPRPFPLPKWAQNSQSCDSGDELTMSKYSFTCPLVVLYCCNFVIIHTLYLLAFTYRKARILCLDSL